MVSVYISRTLQIRSQFCPVAARYHFGTVLCSTELSGLEEPQGLLQTQVSKVPAFKEANKAKDMSPDLVTVLEITKDQ